MKKILILVVLGVVLTTLNAQTNIFYRATSVNFKFENEWLGWQKTDIILETYQNKIIIYSQIPQYIDLDIINGYRYYGYTLYKGIGYKDNILVKVRMYYYDNKHIILIIESKTLTIKYRLIEYG